MADLRKFLWDGVRTGMLLDLYLNRWPKIGNGRADLIEKLHVKVSGESSVLKFNIDVEVIMPDESMSGQCVVILNGKRADNCNYLVKGGTLTINHPQAQIKLQAKDKKWSWIHVNNPILAWSALAEWPEHPGRRPFRGNLIGFAT